MAVSGTKGVGFEASKTGCNVFKCRSCCFQALKVRYVHAFVLHRDYMVCSVDRLSSKGLIIAGV